MEDHSEPISVSNSDENPGLGLQSPHTVPSPDLNPATSDLDHEAEKTLHHKLEELNLKEDGNLKELEEVEKESNQSNVEENGKEGSSEDDENGSESENNEDEKFGYDELERKDNERANNRWIQYPVRPDAEDCAYYMKTGTCKFGSNCKFNHPVRRKSQATKDKVKERDESVERTNVIECKYYLRTGGCKFGKACRYNHSRAKTVVAPILELNFLGLPIRAGEKECPYYMRNGSCKYGANCRFNHPDPTTVGGTDPPSGYGNGGSVSLAASSQSSAASWSSPRAINESAPFVPIMFSPTQGVPPQSSEWNGYQTPVYHPESGLHQPPPPPPAYVISSPVATETNIYSHHQQQMLVDEFPERPGQPECSYFLKTGDCKFKSNCKFHHPKGRISKPPPCALSDKGLPLRPDQNICSHYSRYGICKFGPACKFDHPVQPASSTGSDLDQPAPFGNSVTAEVATIAESGNGNDNASQWPV